MTNRTIFIRCDAGDIPEIGTGHLRRDLLLADELKKNGADIIFITASPLVADKTKRAGYSCFTLHSVDDISSLLKFIRTHNPETIVWDRLETSLSMIRPLKETGISVVTLDDEGPGQAHADLTINAMFEGGETEYKGLDYAILNPDLSYIRSPFKPRVDQITVTFGGFDSQNITLKVLKALASANLDIRINAIVGASYSQLDLIRQLPFKKAQLSLHQAPTDFHRILGQSDIAIVAGGLTLVDALYLGVPCLAIAQYEHQRKTILRLQRQGCVVSLGHAEQLSEKSLILEVNQLINDPKTRQSLREKGQSLVDGKGIERVCDLILNMRRDFC